MNHETNDDSELLTASQAAEILGIRPGTLRTYASRGQAPAGRKLGGARRWTRAEIEHRRDNPPSADPARRGGRPKNVREARPRPSQAGRRAGEVAARLRAGEDVTVPQLMKEYNATERTAQRLLARARALAAAEG
ncbi:hypothetical protein GCM10009716_41420 [Streptomyces sodiiphilus]|uniref:Helix-turn-helix domain-containing protein n=1 Tax=Streptomyces sodiiphilus TaxID=226217 RepID=A0ABN2PQV9_9ACTN